MKVAIVGAGIAGLSCAYELEKYGIRPDIFEVQDTFGGRGFNHTAGWMNIMYRPVKDAVEYLKKDFGIVIKPMERVTQVDFYSKNETVTITGPKLGYILLVGPAPGSINHQLAAHIRTPVQFGQIVNVRDLARQYDYVVVATGTPEIPMVLGNWRTDIAGYVYGANVAGEFSPQTIKIWFNTQWCQRGYAYFVPWNDRKGSLVINVQEIGSHGAQKCWQKFLADIKWDIDILEVFETPHNIGHVYQRRYKNILFAGLAGGFVDPLFAFGQIAAVDSGASAAKAIAEGADYDQLVTNWLRRNNDLRIVRRYVDKFSDDDFDLALRVIRAPFFRTVVTRSNVNLIRILSFVAKAMVSHKIERMVT
ncbi:MAG TPA: NAD(P)-binding protein [Bacillota bacterium]|nr:NAD(P)-binding protein [Bacillota bacterium]HQE02405.1 NAD(P)-binding protein [Bacillota bacterium]